MTPLNPLSIPLYQTNLIEASAGTGKTYTIGSLYLRLLLQEGRKVEEILVVTFTEMATQDLKRKIRERLMEALDFVTAARANPAHLQTAFDPFLTPLLETLSLDEALQRLQFALQDLDLAAIFTIHGFCRRMLLQHAFHSGVHFDMQLAADSSELYRRLAEDFWREHFYPLSFKEAAVLAKLLKTPENVLAQLKGFIGHNFPLSAPEKARLGNSIEAYLQGYIASIDSLKALWRNHSEEISAVIFAELTKSYKKGEKKALDRNKFKKPSVTNWLAQIDAWALDAIQWEIPEKLPERFTQSALNNYAEADATPLTHDIFSQLEDALAAVSDTQILKKGLLYHYLQGINQALLDYRQNHLEKGFDDLLRLLSQALHQPNGAELAALIRRQYPFAMIDEFQDTDGLQYGIFAKIYGEKMPKSGFMMIGDPKQAIYRFRGADIFTYLSAAANADGRFDLGKNYRSEAHVVEAVNHLFNFPEKPFIYQDIPFHPVSARDDLPRFLLNQQIEPALRCYLSKDYSLENAAQTTAIAIQQWLIASQNAQAHFGDEPLQAENIAVLVRNFDEAAQIKKALQKLGIASVYLSDKSSVFDSPVAAELALILRACLESSERNILNAIGSSLFALNAAQIRQIHQDENQWQKWAEDFAAYRQTWQRQGVLAMLQQLILNQRISEKLLARTNGERLLTDLLHLAELLQEAASLQESAAALLHWFEKELRNEANQEVQIRLESERQLVKIVTVHKSKGLEYDLVCLPFLGLPSKAIKSDVMQRYYDNAASQLQWDLQGAHLEQLTQEIFAEELRLLYVALTRAKYQMLLCLPEEFSEAWNPLLYCLTQGAIGEQAALSQTYATQALLATWPNLQIDQASQLTASPALRTAKNAEMLAAEPFVGEIEQHWQISSFSAIEAQHSRNQLSEIFEFEENDKDYLDVSLLIETENSEPSAINTWLGNLPRGRLFGTQLHRFAEKTPFQQWGSLESAEKLCSALRLSAENIAPMQQWLTQIINTPLFSNGFSLAQIPPQDALKEMAFYMNIADSFSAHKFNQALQQFHHLASAPLAIEQIQGMLRGTMDLVVRYQGKYYLLDYKSNFLGENAAAYQQEALKEVMLAQHYDWQYLIYCVALHRYLRERDPKYQYAEHFGGVFYTFLRGMNGDTASGVFFDKPDEALINALEKLF